MDAHYREMSPATNLFFSFYGHHMWYQSITFYLPFSKGKGVPD